VTEVICLCVVHAVGEILLCHFFIYGKRDTMCTSPVPGRILSPGGYPERIVRCLASLSPISPRFLSATVIRPLSALCLDRLLLPHRLCHRQTIHLALYVLQHRQPRTMSPNAARSSWLRSAHRIGDVQLPWPIPYKSLSNDEL
jgi:hypothetical protein